MTLGNHIDSLWREIACGLTATAMAACGTQASPEVETSTEAADDLYVSSGDIWTPGVIPVCWENASSGNVTERGWVASAIANTWESQSAVRFIGWGSCSASSPGIHILISDEGPHTTGLGDSLDSDYGGMVLNFTFNNWSTSCMSSREFCIRTIAVHEFGHALGFAHEQNRPDTPSWCDQEQGSDGDVLVGVWDLDSVMNYCNPNWNGNGNLSATDIAGVRRYYGPPVSSQRVFHGLRGNLYQMAFNDFVADGYRPVWVDFNTINILGSESVYVSAVFSNTRASWVARHGMTGAQYQSEFDLRTSQGFRLAQIDTYPWNGSILYAALFEVRSGPAWVAYHGRTAADHQAQFNNLVAQGYRPVNISPTMVNGTTYFAALYDQASVGSFYTLSGLTSAQYQQYFDANVAAGRHLAYLTTYQNGTSPLFSAIWNQAPTGSWVARHDQSLIAFRDDQIQYSGDGKSLRCVTAYQNGFSMLFGGLWSSSP
jgi:hypothetical protein